MEGKNASSSFATTDKKNRHVHHIMEMSPMTAEVTTQPSHLYQPLQMNQRSKDHIYQDRALQKQSESEYELVEEPVTNVHTQQQPNVYQPLKQDQIHKNEIYQGPSTGGAGSDDTKPADSTSVKKMKIVLLVTVTVNIAMLLLIITAAILGVIQIQSKFEQVMTTQNLSMSQINELTASTNENISQISMQLQQNISQVSSQLNAINRDIGELTALTYHNISMISLQLTATNDNITSVLNQLDTNQGHITTQLEAAYSNINFLQEYVTSLQMQVGYLHRCGPGEWHRVAYLDMKTFCNVFEL